MALYGRVYCKAVSLDMYNMDTPAEETRWIGLYLKDAKPSNIRVIYRPTDGHITGGVEA